MSRSLDHPFRLELHVTLYVVIYLFCGCYFIIFYKSVVFSRSFLIMFVILLAVMLSSVWSLQNMPLFLSFDELFFVWILLYISNIFVLALNIIYASSLLNLFICVCLMPGFQVVLLIIY